MYKILPLLLTIIALQVSLTSFASDPLPPILHKVIYVDSSNADIAFDGLSWDSAYVDLQDAIDAANEKDTIWVAHGTYYPRDSMGATPTNPRASSIFIDKNIVILGGFKGDETSATQRDIKAFPCILSGDIDGTPNDNSGNAYHVVWMQYLDSCMTLDGFTITKGNANIPNTNDPQRGGGVYNLGSDSTTNPTFKNCDFVKNFAILGAGVYNAGAGVDASNTSTFINCSFKGNTTNTGLNGGGGVLNDGVNGGNSSPIFINCLFSGNIADYGSAISNFVAGSGFCSPKIINCTMAGNNDRIDGTVVNFNLGGTIENTFINTIIQGNNSGIAAPFAPATNNFYYCLIQGEVGSIPGNLDGDTNPFFIDSVDFTLAPNCEGNYGLSSCSPAINAGEKNSIPVGIFSDLLGAMRIQKDTVDMGAIESSYQKGGHNLIYVDSSNHEGIQNGYTWNTAFSDLQDAIDAAWEKDTIWIAKGTYVPNRDTSGLANARLNTFFIKKNLIILGGFNGDETSESERNWRENKTILSGDRGTPGAISDNVYHVLWMQYLDSCALLDGVTITKGNANGGGNDPNRGGGIFNLGNNGTTSPTFRNCHFVKNSAVFGGGVYNYGHTGVNTSTFINCSFKGNSASGGAGAVENDGNLGNSSPTYINCLFSGNSADIGSAVGNFADAGGVCYPKYINCTMAGNNATTNGTVLNYNVNNTGTIVNTFINTIISGNSHGLASIGTSMDTATYSLIQGETDITNGNLDGSLDPEYLYSLDYDQAPTCLGKYNLKPCSPAINAGNNNSIPDGIITDFGGFQRIQQVVVDMGSFESPFDGAGNLIIYVDSSNTDAIGDGLSWTTAFTDLQDALGLACYKDTVWVAKGTYFPSDSSGTGILPVDSRQVSFFIDDEIILLGGFAGNETSAEQRDWETNQTILSGDIGNSEDNSDNTYHVVWLDYLDDSCFLMDGFIITNGNADGNDAESKGGGIYANGYDHENYNRFANCIFRDNSADEGGGIFLDGEAGWCTGIFTDCSFENNEAGDGGGAYLNGEDGECYTSFTNCEFTENEADEGGALVIAGGDDGENQSYFEDCSFKKNIADEDGGAIGDVAEGSGTSSATYVRCTFQGNEVQGGDGGAIAFDAEGGGEVTPTFISCLFSGNHAGSYGGAVSFDGESGGKTYPLFTNCTFAGNTAGSSAGAIYNDVTGGMNLISFENTIVWGNSSPAIDGGNDTLSIRYSLIQGEIQDTSGNIPDSLDPQFILLPDTDAAPTCEGNFNLKPCSPAINAGNNFYLATSDTLDIEGEDRIQKTIVDMGAFESPFDGVGNLVIYVDSSQTDTINDGLTWATAFNDLQDALDLACDKDTIWVAGGTYFPSDSMGTGLDPENPRQASFFIDENVILLGGFDGSETDSESRDWDLNKTVLSGDIGLSNDSSDNAYHVVWMQYLDSCMLLDGFTITKGNANIPATNFPARGGGVMNYGNDSTTAPTFQHCSFVKNSAVFGGGVYNYGKNGVNTSKFIDCFFQGNTTSSLPGAPDGGGAVENDGNEGDCSPSFINCVFSGNKAGLGSAIANYAFNGGVCNPTYINCTMAGNNAVDSGTVYNFNENNTGYIYNTFHNTVLWGNSDGIIDGEGTSTSSFAYCLIQDTLPPGPGNLDGKDTLNDPAFVVQPNFGDAPTCEGNLSLPSCSPLINRGLNSLVPDEISEDIAGNDRIQVGIVDIGAYESGSPGLIPVCNDITVTLDEGSYSLNSLDSALISAGNEGCFDSIVFSHTNFDCSHLQYSPISATMTAYSGAAGAQNCSFDITLLEDPDYCCAVGQYSFFNHIKSVELISSEDTMLNVSNDDNGYGPYTGIITDVNAGSFLKINLMSFTINPVVYKYWHIWIDYDDDGEYELNELVYQSQGNQGMKNTQITIRQGQSGIKTMRISMRLNPGFPQPCGGFSYGEVEDYSININDCPEVLLLENQSIGGVYSASKQIITKGEVEVTSDTEFRAQEFFLGKSFKVIDGIRFETIKNPCGVPIPPVID